MRWLILAVALVAVEVAAVAYWWGSEGWDCGVDCSIGQRTAGWIGLVLPIVGVGLAVFAVVRWRRRRS